MLDEHEIMPFNFFKYGGVYSGEHHGMRYLIKRIGEKPDFKLTAYVWPGPYCFAETKDELKLSIETDYSCEGRIKAIEWMKKMYEERKEQWDNIETVLNAPINMDVYLPKENTNGEE